MLYTLSNIIKDIDKGTSVPGINGGYTSFITKKGQVVEGFNGCIVTCDTLEGLLEWGSEVDYVINSVLSPLVVSRGIYCKGVERNSWLSDAKFSDSEEIVENKDGDYEIDIEILNYVYSVIGAIQHSRKMKDGEIIMIRYSTDAESTSFERFGSIEELEYSVYDEGGIEKTEEDIPVDIKIIK